MSEQENTEAGEFSESEQKIFQNLQQLESLAKLDNVSDKDLIRGRELMHLTIDWVVDSINNVEMSDLKLPTQVLDLIECLNEVNYRLDQIRC